MKILIVTGAYPPDIGGPATYSELLFNELPKKGIETAVLSFGCVRRQPKVVRHISFFFKTLWAARASDVVFAQDTVSVGLPALAASFVLGKIFVVRVPGDYAWEQSVQRFGVTDTIDAFQGKKYGFRTELLRKVQRLVVGKADRAITPSRYFAELVRGWVKDPGKVTHIYNGIDLAEIAAAKAPGSFVPRTILSAGRLVPWKGFAMLIRAMKDLPGWSLKIAGDGPDMESLRQIINEAGLSGRVALVGRLPKRELLAEISRSEIFALNTSFESFSFQIVEAMALGTPTIATRVGNLSEIIDDGASGILIEPDDQAAFVAAVKKITGDASFRTRLVETARTKAQSFSIEATMAGLTDVIAHIRTHDHEARKGKVFAAKVGRYLFSGGIAAVTNLVLLYVLTDLAHIWYLISSVLSFLVAFMVSFFLQKFFTFQDHGREDTHKQALVYLLVTGTNLVINTALIYALVQYAGFHYLVAQILTSIAIAVESYVIYGMFIFKK